MRVLPRHLHDGRRPRQAGFTLIELLMGIIIAGIFAGGLYAFFFAGTDAARTSESVAGAQADGREALRRFTRDIRQAVSPDGGLTPPVERLSATEIVMYVDPRRDPGATEPRPDRVRYRVDGTEFVREAVGPVGASAPFSYGPFGRREVLAERVEGAGAPTFTARTVFDGTLPLPVVAPGTRYLGFVSVRLILGHRSGNSSESTEVGTDATLRNAVRI